MSQDSTSPDSFAPPRPLPPPTEHAQHQVAPGAADQHGAANQHGAAQQHGAGYQHVAHPVAQFPPGWYPDPLQPHAWRWWNGIAWTAHQSGHRSKPLLPSWLSWPVVVCAVPVVLLLLFGVVTAPLAAAASVIPGLIAIPVFVWLDRIEPEPWTTRIHAVLWGATVAILGAGIVNVTVFFVFGETTATVLSAPIIEECLKALGLVIAVRRREIDSMTDGVIFAGLIAIGFAMVEDVEYFASADAIGQFWPVFIVRGLLTPFAHPLFTMWAGLAIGREVAAGRGLNIVALWGVLVAIGLHAVWNTTAVALDKGILQVAEFVGLLGLFVVLFLAVAIALVWARRRERQLFDRVAPIMVRRYGLSPVECQWFSSYRAALAYRRQLPRSARKPFDGMRAAIARLASLEDRNGPAELETVYASDLATERRLLAESTAQRWPQ